MSENYSDLAKRHCEACEGGVAPVDLETAQLMLKQAQGWSVAADGKEIERVFKFANFHETMAFVNAVAWVAHHEDHHPDMDVGYSRCRVRYSTHAIGGLSVNDFICAAKINELLA